MTFDILFLNIKDSQTTVLNKNTTEETCRSVFNIIFNHLDNITDQKLIQEYDDSLKIMKISYLANIKRNGWIYNSTETQNIPLYELSLIKIHELSCFLPERKILINTESQTDQQPHNIITNLPIQKVYCNTDYNSNSNSDSDNDSDFYNGYSDLSIRSDEIYQPLLSNWNPYEIPYNYKCEKEYSPLFDPTYITPYISHQESLIANKFPSNVVLELKNRLYQDNFGLEHYADKCKSLC
jgi:hypothetical protein